MQPTNRNPLTPLNHRHTRHINTRNRPHQLIQRTIRTTITNPTPTPHLRNQTPLNISKHINGADERVLVGAEHLQDLDEPGEQRLGGGGIEPVRCVFQMNNKFGAIGSGDLVDLEAEVELGSQRSGMQILDLQPGKTDSCTALSGLRNMSHHDLEQRVPTRHTSRSHSTNDHVKRNPGVIERPQDRIPGTLNNCRNSRIPRKIVPNRHRVDEKTNQRFQTRVITSRGNSPQHNIVSCPKTVQQHRHSSLTHHEHRRPTPGGQTLQPGQNLSGNHNPHHPGGPTPGPDRRQHPGQPSFLGHTSQPGPPPVNLDRQHTLIHLLVLPQRVISVSDLKRIP